MDTHVIKLDNILYLKELPVIFSLPSLKKIPFVSADFTKYFCCIGTINMYKTISGMPCAVSKYCGKRIRLYIWEIKNLDNFIKMAKSNVMTVLKEGYRTNAKVRGYLNLLTRMIYNSRPDTLHGSMQPIRERRWSLQIPKRCLITR